MTKMKREDVSVMKNVTIPTPVKTQSRIFFGIAFFATEADALAYSKLVKHRGDRHNGGYFHGMPCGRDSSFDYVDSELGQLFAVTNAARRR